MQQYRFASRETKRWYIVRKIRKRYGNVFFYEDISLIFQSLMKKIMKGESLQLYNNGIKGLADFMKNF